MKKWVMQDLHTFSLIGTTALHCGQTLFGGMTNGNSRNSQPPSALHRNWEEMVASVHTTTRGKYYNAHACRFPQEKWPTVRMAVNGGIAGSLFLLTSRRMQSIFGERKRGFTNTADTQVGAGAGAARRIP